VMAAIRNGHRTRDEIKKQSRLGWEVAMDTIAEGIDQGVLRLKRIDGEAYFYERVA